MKKLIELARHDAGAMLIELALVAPVLALMVMGISDVSSAFSKRLELEQAAQRAIEMVMQTTGEDTPEGTIKREAVCQYNGILADGTCKTAPITVDNVTVEYTLTCDGVVKDYTTTDCTGAQIEYRYIKATVTDTYTPMFPIHFGTGADGKYSLTATVGVRVA